MLKKNHTKGTEQLKTLFCFPVPIKENYLQHGKARANIFERKMKAKIGKKKKTVDFSTVFNHHFSLVFLL